MANPNTTKHDDMGMTDTAKMTDTVDDRNKLPSVAEVVQNLVGGTSKRFVPRPSDDTRTIDIINGLADFKRQCCWAEYWRIHIRNKSRFDSEQTLWAKWFAEHPELLSDELASDPNWKFPNPIDMCTYDKSLEVWTSDAATSGFKTGLRAEKKLSRGPEGSQELECFLKALEEASSPNQWTKLNLTTRRKTPSRRLFAIYPNPNRCMPSPNETHQCQPIKRHPALEWTLPPPLSCSQQSQADPRSNPNIGQARAVDREVEIQRPCSIYFKAGFTDYWRQPLPKIIQEIKACFSTLSWLHVSLSYHRFHNLRELFRGDLNTKLNEDLSSLDFKNLPCNCRNRAGCAYLGKCRSSIVVYQATCLATKKKYIGNTQQKVKARIQQHVQDTKLLFIEGKKSDSLANHFAGLVPKNMEKKQVRNFVKLKVDILWQGDPLSSCVKTFGTQSCKLCAKERMAIIKLTRLNPHKAINKCN